MDVINGFRMSKNIGWDLEYPHTPLQDDDLDDHVLPQMPPRSEIGRRKSHQRRHGQRSMVPLVEACVLHTPTHAALHMPSRVGPLTTHARPGSWAPAGFGLGLRPRVDFCQHDPRAWVHRDRATRLGLGNLAWADSQLRLGLGLPDKVDQVFWLVSNGKKTRASQAPVNVNLLP